MLLAACLLLVIAISPLQLAFPRTGLVLAELGAILLPALLFLRRKHPDLRNALRWRPISAVQGALALGIGLTGWGVAVLLVALVSLALGPPPAVEGLQATSAADWLMVVAVVAVLPALCEETLFRGCLQGVFERRGPVPGVLLTGVLFGAFHLVPHSMLAAAFLGIVLGTLVVRTGSILAGVLAHFGNNFMLVFPGEVLGEFWQQRAVAVGGEYSLVRASGRGGDVGSPLVLGSTIAPHSVRVPEQRSVNDRGVLIQTVYHWLERRYVLGSVAPLGPAPTSTSTASGMRVISPTSPAPTLNSTGRLSHKLLAQGGPSRRWPDASDRGRSTWRGAE